jgi:hypothetical protein
MQVKVKDTSLHVKGTILTSAVQEDLPRLHRKTDRQSLFYQNDELLANYSSCNIYIPHVPKIRHKPISNPFTHPTRYPRKPWCNHRNVPLAPAYRTLQHTRSGRGKTGPGTLPL